MKLKIYLVCFCIIKIILSADESNPMPLHFCFEGCVYCSNYELSPVTLSTSCKINCCALMDAAAAWMWYVGTQDQEERSCQLDVGGLIYFGQRARFK